jgi:cytochrome c-type biogenesis protein CcmH/NrfF
MTEDRSTHQSRRLVRLLVKPFAVSILIACVLFWPTLSRAQTGINQAPSALSDDAARHAGTVGFTSPPELESRPRSEFQSSLMHELACTCGTCKLEPIDTCRCEFAAKMRAEVLAQLDGLDVSTDEARRATADAVRTSFVARYGPKVLERNNRLDPSGRVAGLVVAAIVLLVLVGILRGIRSIRRGTRPPDADRHQA